MNINSKENFDVNGSSITVWKSASRTLCETSHFLFKVRFGIKPKVRFANHDRNLN